MERAGEGGRAIEAEQEALGFWRRAWSGTIELSSAASWGPTWLLARRVSAGESFRRWEGGREGGREGESSRSRSGKHVFKWQKVEFKLSGKIVHSSNKSVSILMSKIFLKNNYLHHSK